LSGCQEENAITKASEIPTVEQQQVSILFRFFLGKQGICAAHAKNREFPLGWKSRFLLVGGTAPYPLTGIF
jgi:hypothetical protein